MPLFQQNHWKHWDINRDLSRHTYMSYCPFICIYKLYRLLYELYFKRVCVLFSIFSGCFDCCGFCFASWSTWGLCMECLCSMLSKLGCALLSHGRGCALLVGIYRLCYSFFEQHCKNHSFNLSLVHVQGVVWRAGDHMRLWAEVEIFPHSTTL